MATKATINTIQDVFDWIDRRVKGNSGGSTKLAMALGLHTYTVEGWRRHGIPQKHWMEIIEQFNLTPAELYVVSRKCKERKMRRGS